MMGVKSYKVGVSEVVAGNSVNLTFMGLYLFNYLV